MTVPSVLDAAGRRRSPATMPGYHVGRPPRNKGIRYPGDTPTVDERSTASVPQSMVSCPPTRAARRGAGR